MTDFLKHLTAEDRVMLRKESKIVSYEPEGVIVKQGEDLHAICVLRSGVARVERDHMGFYVEIARLVEGEIFGEMSFLDNFETSAGVIADQACEVEVIDSSHVQALIENHPGFAGRFYRSIAEILSQRLRQTSIDGIAEYSWGGMPEVSDESELDPSGDWSGGSPLRDDFGG